MAEAIKYHCGVCNVTYYSAIAVGKHEASCDYKTEYEKVLTKEAPSLLGGARSKPEIGDGNYFDFLRRGYELRQRMVKEHSWAILNGQTLKVLRSFGPFVEVGAGSGYWAFEMKKVGIDVIATDISPLEKNYYEFRKSWTDVEVLPAVDAVKKYEKRTLLMVWPCYDKPWACEALKAYKGNTLVFVGEGPWGCTADESFWNEIEEKWEETDYHFIPKWEGIHDALQVYRRK